MAPSAFRSIVLAALVIAAAGDRPALQASSRPGSDAPPAVADAVLQPPTGFTVRAQSGSTITLGWIPPASGPAPAGYVLEGGFAPGDVLAALPLGAASPTFTVTAPAGVFFLRLHAVTGSERSAASNEIRVVVGVALAPSPPANLLGLVNGSTLQLSWSNTFSGGPATQLWLQISGTASVLVPLPLGESFSYSGIPDGTYTFTLIAANDSGASAPSNAVTLSFPAACSGPPHAPADFQTWTDGGTFHVAWAPPASGPAVATYTVQVSGTFGGAVVTTARTISGPLPPGDYAVSVVASNACGDSVPAPAAPDWTAVVRHGATDVISWPGPPREAGYRVYWSTSRASVQTLDATTPFVAASGSPVALPAADPAAPVYYRVFAVHGPVAGAGGPVALATTFTLNDYPDWPGTVTPALWDLDGDDCLDMVGARGLCDGRFAPSPLAGQGLEGLTAGKRQRLNRDSRFADFTGDGITDIFTNVYTRADDPDVAAILHVGNAAGGFSEDPGVAAMRIRGYGETVVAADFDNDGDIDIFLPHYTHLNDGGKNVLLRNDGAGHFVDVAAAAGVAVNAHAPPEGAQAIDVNQDGWIDLHVASQLFINQGDMTFVDQAAALGLPVLFDEGMRLFDVDLDGDFDLLHHDASVTRLFVNDGSTYVAGLAVLGAEGSTIGYGLNVCDVNGDGFEDVLVASNALGQPRTGHPRLLVNAGGTLTPSDLPPAAGAVYNDLLACGDLDRSGLPDVVGRWLEEVMDSEGQPVGAARFRTYVNRGTAGAPLRVRITGAGGERNQQGRVVRIRPAGAPGRTLMRVVESGSGYMAQNDYDLTVAAPWPGTYEVAVRFPDGWVTTTAHPGDVLTIGADGAVRPGLH